MQCMPNESPLCQRICNWHEESGGIFRFNKEVKLILYNLFKREHSYLVGVLISRLSLYFDIEYHILCYWFVVKCTVSGDSVLEIHHMMR